MKARAGGGWWGWGGSEMEAGGVAEGMAELTKRDHLIMCIRLSVLELSL